MPDDIKKTLWLTADKLRANMDAAEYKHLVLGLIFVKYISDTFAARRAELTARLSNPADPYYYGDAAPEDLQAELEDRDHYTEVNAFWVPEPARWESLRGAAKQVDIGKRIDDALSLIEQENPTLKGILDKRYARAQLPDGKLGELVDLISTIGFGDNPSTARDVLGLLPPLHLLLWCRQNMENIKARANGSTFMEINKKAFLPIPALVPAPEIIQSFTDVAGRLFDRLIENEKQAQTLATLRDTLLPRLISGQLRLPEADAMLEEACA